MYRYFNSSVRRVNKGIQPQFRGRQSQRTKFWCQQKPLVTSVICYKFQKNFFEVWFYTIFHDFIHVYSPRHGLTTPWGRNFQVNRNVLSPRSFFASSKIIFLKSDFIQFFSWFFMYTALGQGQTAPHCFTFFPNKSIRDQIWPCHKIGQGQPRVIIWTKLVVLKHPMLHTKFQGWFRRKRFFYGFYHLWARWPSWSCDQDHLNKLSFPHPMETPYEIWLQSAQWFLRRGCLKIPTTEACLSYKLTTEPSTQVS